MANPKQPPGCPQLPTMTARLALGVSKRPTMMTSLRER